MDGEKEGRGRDGGREGGGGRTEGEGGSVVDVYNMCVCVCARARACVSHRKRLVTAGLICTKL